MAQLSEYKRKRNFRVTSEPAPQVASKKGHSFVIQKHAARRLHYDFRLELDGVLKSWAVPKGPCLDPGVKRLAVEVEDHPLSYGSFEGTIPQGEYGGGSVIVWDRGTWEPEGDPHTGLLQGRLHFVLHGEKLSGRWNLVRGRSVASGKPQWLLIKSRDQAAQPAAAYDVEAARPESVITGIAVEQVAARVDAKGRLLPTRAGARATPRQTRKPRGRGKTKAGAAAGQADEPPAASQEPQQPSPLPEFIAPQLAVLSSAPPPGEHYVHEIKFDGYRVLARSVYNGGAPEVVLHTRTGKDWTDKFAAIAEAVACLDVESVYLDGEVVALDAKGRSDFQRLQNSLNGRDDAALHYFVFDLLYLNGYDLRRRPLGQRKELLGALLAHNPHPLLRYSQHFTGSGTAVLRRCCQQRLEGIVCKDRRAPYVSSRTADWMKVKCKNRQEFVIIGYTNPKGTRAHLGALLLGAHAADGALRYAGRVGTGMRTKTLHDLKEQLSALKTAKPQVDDAPPSREITWVKPHLVAEVEFSEFTDDNILRHASFVGLRADKPAAEVVLEAAAPAPSAARASAAPSDATALPLTHPDRILFAPDGPTKRELADYYARIKERMWPYVQGHPLALLRCPDGTQGTCFFHKHLTSTSVEPGLATVAISEKHAVRHYRYLDAPAGLRSLVQLGVLELHLWGSRADDVEHPIELVFDLDPAPDVPWARTIEGAARVRKLLQRLGLRSFLKLSGGKGVHLHVPIAPRYDWELAKRFCHAVARQLAEEEPSLFTVALAKRERTGKIFLDYLRNGRGATYVAPFSARAREGAPIAAPIAWSALSKDLLPDAYTVRTLDAYLRRYPRDPWAGYAELRQPIAMLAES